MTLSSGSTHVCTFVCIHKDTHASKHTRVGDDVSAVVVMALLLGDGVHGQHLVDGLGEVLAVPRVNQPAAAQRLRWWAFE